ncbi:zingipain-1-like [Bidens hawaiensis]|uniref:zingipain-1-like n=1 Tax=Bidens hawaiensis TaxID=980011 RepID=UPI00404B2E93
MVDNDVLEVDWRFSFGPVKDLGRELVCWAFSVVNAIEAYVYIAQQRRVRISEQQLIDCDNSGDFNIGFNRGNPYKVVKFIVGNDGYVYSLQHYPYVAQPMNCDPEKIVAVIFQNKLALMADNDVLEVDWRFAFSPIKDQGRQRMLSLGLSWLWVPLKLMFISRNSEWLEFQSSNL